jgi:hypothetical protein
MTALQLGSLALSGSLLLFSGCTPPPKPQPTPAPKPTPTPAPKGTAATSRFSQQITGNRWE